VDATGDVFNSIVAVEKFKRAGRSSVAGGPAPGVQ
jgi:hypothetical protein